MNTAGREFSKTSFIKFKKVETLTAQNSIPPATLGIAKSAMNAKAFQKHFFASRTIYPIPRLPLQFWLLQFLFICTFIPALHIFPKGSGCVSHRRFCRFFQRYAGACNQSNCQTPACSSKCGRRDIEPFNPKRNLKR